MQKPIYDFVSVFPDLVRMFVYAGMLVEWDVVSMVGVAGGHA